jgi:hypothetical protein
MKTDFWARPYDFSRKVEEDRIVLRITSAGKNGKLEDGGGDDIVCEVIIPKTGRGTYKITAEGRTYTDED